MFKLVLEKAEKPEMKLLNTCWITENTRELLKNIYFCFIDYTKASVWITTNCGEFLKRLEYQNTLPASWEVSIQVKKQQWEPDMEQQTGSKLGKEYIKVYISPCLFNL